jgi:hypothetical protein
MNDFKLSKILVENEIINISNMKHFFLRRKRELEETLKEMKDEFFEIIQTKDIEKMILKNNDEDINEILELINLMYNYQLDINKLKSDIREQDNNINNFKRKHLI